MDCGQGLRDADGLTARCTQPHGTEHSHHDNTAREAVALGIAELAPWLVPCAGTCGDLVDVCTALTHPHHDGVFCEACYLDIQRT